MKALIHATIFDFHRFQENQYVLYDELIRQVGPMEAYPGCDGEVLDAEGMLVLPGFVIAHTHIYSAFARGLSLPFAPKNFQDILDQLWWKLDAQIDKQIAYDSAVVFAAEAIERGVTTIFDHHASGKDILGTLTALRKAIVSEAGLRGAFCFETSDRFDIEACIAENVSFSKVKQSDTAAYFGLHASSSLSEATLRKVAQARGNSPIHIHVAESLDDQNDCLLKYQERVVERLDRHGLIDERSLLIHGIHLNEAELAILQKRNARIVVNPSSNANNAVGFPDVKKMQSKHIRIALGNDGMNAGITSEFLTLYLQSKQFGSSPIAFDLEDLKAVLRENFALASEAFHLPIGRIEEGFAADLQLIDYAPVTKMDESNAFGHLVYGLFDAWRPRHVFAKGKQVLSDFTLSDTMKERLSRARNSSHVLWDRLKEERA
jgi:cytosine/adenosine deaminase-related metal-dependent hydrolase